MRWCTAGERRCPVLVAMEGAQATAGRASSKWAAVNLAGGRQCWAVLLLRGNSVGDVQGTTDVGAQVRVERTLGAMLKSPRACHGSPTHTSHASGSTPLQQLEPGPALSYGCYSSDIYFYKRHSAPWILDSHVNHFEYAQRILSTTFCCFSRPLRTSTSSSISTKNSWNIRRGSVLLAAWRRRCTSQSSNP